MGHSTPTLRFSSPLCSCSRIAAADALSRHPPPSVSIIQVTATTDWQKDKHKMSFIQTKLEAINTKLEYAFIVHNGIVPKNNEVLRKPYHFLFHHFFLHTMSLRSTLRCR